MQLAIRSGTVNQLISERKTDALFNTFVIFMVLENREHTYLYTRIKHKD